MSSFFLQTQLLYVGKTYVRGNPLAEKVLLVADVVEIPSKFPNKPWKAAQRANEAITKVIGYLQKKQDTEVDRKSLPVKAINLTCCIDNLLVDYKINPLISLCSQRIIDSKFSELVKMMLVILHLRELVV